MAVVGKNSKTWRVEIPFENGEWMEIKRLSWRQLEACAEVQTNTVLARMKNLGGDLVSAMRGAVSDQEQKQGSKYDRGSVLVCGIVRWSYSEEVTPTNIDALDEETAAWAFQEILALNNPRTDAERKND